jgi:hypothetical protein
LNAYLNLIISLLIIWNLSVLYLYVIDLYFDKQNKYKQFYSDERLKELFGTYLFNNLFKIEKDEVLPKMRNELDSLVPKITGMLIELDNNELLTLVNNTDLMKEKYNEAIKILEKSKYL